MRIRRAVHLCFIVIRQHFEVDLARILLNVAGEVHDVMRTGLTKMSVYFSVKFLQPGILMTYIGVSH